LLIESKERRGKLQQISIKAWRDLIQNYNYLETTSMADPTKQFPNDASKETPFINFPMAQPQNSSGPLVQSMLKNNVSQVRKNISFKAERELSNCTGNAIEKNRNIETPTHIP
jgi:hypothetical protein